MSKIYQALEKAEKEREMEFIQRDSSPAIESKELETERHEIFPESKNMQIGIRHQQLVSFSDPGSLVAEQFRKLRTSLQKLASPGSPKTIMVTSARNGEGKTLVSANLAAGIANDLHTHALLVDCDFRKPSLTQWFGLSNGKGIMDHLTGDGNLSELFLKTGIEKLRILPAGKVRDNPAELIGSKKMGALIHELKSKYHDRYIIFDSAPLLATTESEVLGKQVDGIILVVRAGVTPRETVQQALRSLEKEKIIGVVLNDLDFKSSVLYSRYFGSDGYYTTYGKEDQKNHWKRFFRKIK